jgi:hypothetical protein
MRDRQQQKGIAAAKAAALRRKGGPGPLDANDLYGRIAASKDRSVILQAQKVLKKYRFEPAKNRTALAHKLSSIVQMYGEDALRDIAMIHPDRKLIAATVTATELKEVGNEIVQKPVVRPEETAMPKHHYACGACGGLIMHAEGAPCKCGSHGNNQVHNDGGDKAPTSTANNADSKITLGAGAASAGEKDNTTSMIMAALALGLGIGAIATMAFSK